MLFWLFPVLGHCFLFSFYVTKNSYIIHPVISTFSNPERQTSQTEMHNTRWSITHSHASMTDLTHSGVLMFLQKRKVFFCISSLCKYTWYNIRALLDGPHTHRHERTMIMFQQSGSKLPLKPKKPLVYFNLLLRPPHLFHSNTTRRCNIRATLSCYNNGF